MSIALGALRNRTVIGGALVPWTSPLGKPMSIAATVPEFTWSDIAYALTPNGVEPRLPRQRELSERRPPRRRAEAELEQLALPRRPACSATTRRSAPTPPPTSSAGRALTDTGGPFDANPAASGDGHELTANHSAYYLDDSVAPAPALLANGWNDDLFPVDESLRYYNKVRAKYPDAPISMFHLDFGHNPRAGSISAADRAALTAAENAWLDYYVKGVGAEPADARGGVDILTSKCPVSGAGHALPRGLLGAAGAGRDPDRRRRAADDRRARHRAEQRVHVRRRLHHDGERRQRERRDLQGPGRDERLHAGGLADDRRQARRPRAPTTWSPRGSTTSTARRSG